MELSTESESDPRGWSIDRVIQELCETPTPRWSTADQVQLIPDRPLLAGALRQNHVDGDTLLALDMATLKEDLGITSFGQRRAIIKAIEFFRSHSRSYQQLAFQADSIARMQSGTYASPQVTHSRMSLIPQSPAYVGLGIQQSVEPRIPPRSPSMNSTVVLQGNKSMDPPGLASLNPEPPSLPDPFNAALPSSEHRSMPNAPILSLTPGLVVSATKWKSPSSNEPPVNTREGSSTKPMEEPRKEHTIIQAKRRIAPTFVSKLPELVPTESTDNRYFSREAIPLPNVFYYRIETDFGDVFYRVPADDSDDFVISGHYPRGLRGNIARHFKFFLRQGTMVLPRSGSLIKFPYRHTPIRRRADRILRPDSEQLFTLFPRGDRRARVHSLEDFPELKSVQYRQPSRPGLVQPRIHDNSLGDGQPTEPEGGDNSDWGDLDYLIDKYPVEDSDEGLPIYGDSGDEGGFDEETLREIQEEEDEKSREPRTMTRAEAEATIDEAIEEMKREWRDTKFAKVQMKAYRLWMRAARMKNRQPEIYHANHMKERYKNSMDKIKQMILDDVWRNAAELKKQCQSIEPTVSLYEEYSYRSQTILQETAPERPSPESLKAKRPQPRQILEEGEEIIESSEAEPMTEGSEDESMLDDSSEAGSIHHEPDAEEWHPEIPVATRSGGKYSRADERSPGPADSSLEAHRPAVSDAQANDADIDSDSDEDEIVTPARTKKRQAIPKTSPIRIKADPQTPIPKDVRIPSSHKHVSRVTESGSDDSDLDRSPRLPRSRYQNRGRTILEAVDLTRSSPERLQQSANESSGGSIATPPLNPIDMETPKRQKSSKGKEIATFGNVQDDTGLPSHEDVESMLGISWSDIEPLDKRRALAKAVYDLEPDTVTKLVALLASFSSFAERNEVVFNGLIVLDAEDFFIPGIKEKHQNIAQLLVLLYVTYACGQNMLDPSNLSPSCRDNAFADKDNAVEPFYRLLERLLDVFQTYQLAAGEQSRGQKRKRDQRPSPAPESMDDTDLQITDDTSTDQVEEVPPPSSHKKRKRKVEESQQAKTMQLNDKLRMQEQERRRQIMAQKLGKVQIAGDADHIVNTTEPYVHLDPHIAQRVKPHQIHGIQFMWREIIDDPKHQGCILAHTMGLGKTMQVISLLVTISRCNQSHDPTVRSLIPEHLRGSKTLILCPAALLENWMDELLMWTPHNTVLGEIYKGDAARDENIRTIKKWSARGGVLLLSYERFRAYTYRDTSKEVGKEPTDLERILLEEPNLVIADEAHSLKNPRSKINKCAKRLKSLSRIALTGSPLNNHLEEYHAMVDWIAPNYLGDITQFRDKYSDPINAGLYFDSTGFERRLSLRKLHVLKKDLDPKINRADLSVIEKDMPSKTEYFITVPLTDIQRQAYNIYVNAMIQSLSLTGTSVRSAKILEWVSMLGWLCHHPACFLTKLKRLENEGYMSDKSNVTPNGNAFLLDGDESTDEIATPEDPKDVSRQDATPEDLNEDVQLDATGPLSDALRQVLQLFQQANVQGSLSDPAQSYRTLAVKYILEKAVAVGDKTLIFSHSIPTLNYLEGMLKDMKCTFCRLDGSTTPSTRQAYTKEFNQKNSFQVFLISMKAGGLGLNLQGANRVIIFDFSFNPTWEQQAIGRAYRLNQQRPVFVYRFQAGGTFEDVLFNTTVFKTQLFGRVVDKKKPLRHATKKGTHYLFPVKEVPQQNFGDSLRKDPKVLDAIIGRLDCIRSIVLTETFQKEDDEQLDDEEQKAAEEEYRDQLLKREDYPAWQAKQAALLSAAAQRPPTTAPAFSASTMSYPTPSSARRPPGLTTSIHTPSGPGYSFTASARSQPYHLPQPPFSRLDLNFTPRNGMPSFSPTNRPQESPDALPQVQPLPPFSRRANSVEPDVNMS